MRTPWIFALPALLATAPSLARADAPNGAALYTKRCAGCHGDDGKANTRPGKKFNIVDFTAAGWSKDWTQATIEKNVAEGIPGKMPAFSEKMSPAEITAVSQRVLELAGPPAAKPAPAK
jgi:mono/diheme cytochrome c family protein